MKADRYEYPFTSRFVRIDGVSIHYLDEGVSTVIYPLRRINFIQVLPSAEEEDVIGFVRE